MDVEQLRAQIRSANKAYWQDAKPIICIPQNKLMEE